ncbi:MAG: hypothetical protein DI537_11365 [Stutzerimonas stutzeri]|nr:MAG: hypothetical protein DI537_11365 [Stutzerimonas stutzeri]
MQCHQALDVLWEFEIMTRSEAYVMLARAMSLPPERCHFGMFDEEQCRRALRALASPRGFEPRSSP